MSDPKPPRPRKKDMFAYEKLIYEEVLKPFLDHLRSKLEALVGIGAKISRLEAEFAELLRDWDMRMENTQLPLGDILEQVAETHLKVLRAAYQAAIGIDIVPVLSEQAVREFMDNKLRENVGLIRHIPHVVGEKLYSSLRELELSRPFDEQAAAQIIYESGYRGRMRLRLIARDQVSKSVGGLQQIRQEQLGLRTYRWLSSRDERVRPEHVANEGRIFEWATPPSTGHPGQAILCRCRAQPVISEYDKERLRGRP